MQLRVQVRELLQGSSRTGPPRHPSLSACALPPSAGAPSPAPRSSPPPADRRVHTPPALLTRGSAVVFVSKLFPLRHSSVQRQLLRLILLLSFGHRGCCNGCSGIWRTAKGHAGIASASGGRWRWRPSAPIWLPEGCGCLCAAFSRQPPPSASVRRSGNLKPSLRYASMRAHKSPFFFPRRRKLRDQLLSVH